MSDQVEIKTPQFDARFPNQNQTRNCWQNYVDFHKCVKAKGEDYPPCQQFKRAFTSLCPIEWTESWDAQRAEGTYPSKI